MVAQHRSVSYRMTKTDGDPSSLQLTGPLLPFAQQRTWTDRLAGTPSRSLTPSFVLFPSRISWCGERSEDSSPGNVERRYYLQGSPSDIDLFPGRHESLPVPCCLLYRFGKTDMFRKGRCSSLFTPYRMSIDYGTEVLLKCAPGPSMIFLSAPFIYREALPSLFAPQFAGLMSWYLIRAIVVMMLAS